MLTTLFELTELGECFGQRKSQLWLLTSGWAAAAVRGCYTCPHQSQQRFCLCLWGGQGLSPTYTFCVKSHVSLPISHKFIWSVWIKTKHCLSWKLLPLPLRVCQKRIKLHHTKAERKILYFWNFIFQSQAFSCIRLSINLGSCNFDLFTLCLQHILQSHSLLNVL